MLSVRGIKKAFGGVNAVDRLSFEVESHQTTGLVGPNGAGKTTVFNIITGFIKPDDGQVMLNGGDITGWPPSRIARRGIARTFQNVRLFRRLTVLDNILGSIPGQFGENPLYATFLFPAVRRRHKRDVQTAIECLRFVGLENLSGALGGELSYGQQKRIAMARVLASGSDLLLLDEPASGLDPAALSEMVDLIQRLKAAGKTVVLVEHNLEVVRALCDRLLFLNAGAVIADGLPDDLFARDDLSDLYFGQASKNRAALPKTSQ